jgi:inorganic pyrophosphatase
MKKMDVVNIIIETPKGSCHKYTYEPETQTFSHSKTLPLGMCFPYDFGFIPKTKGEDGDPLDVIVMSEAGTFTGCRMKVRIIGCIRAKQREKNHDTIRNDRYLAVPEDAQLFSHVTTYKQFPDIIIKQLEDFFIQYNKLSGKKFIPLKPCGPDKSIKKILDSGYTE